MTTSTIAGVTFVLTQGNIATTQADALVNAANAGLAGGGGVDGAIHRAGGPTIMQECRKIGGCSTGKAAVTGAGNLPARYVFHAVGPVFRSPQESAPPLASAYQSCLDLAESYQIVSIAFPSLSTGAYGYPVHLAAPIALQTVIQHVQQGTCLKHISFILFDQKTLQAYEKAWQKLQSQESL